MPENNAVQILKKDGLAKITESKNVPHAFEVFSLSNPYISIHDGNTATFKIGIKEEKKLFRIVQMNNGGDANVAKPGISMTMQHKVGIGTDTPQERLHINGNLRLDGDILLDKFDKNEQNPEKSLLKLTSTMLSEIQSLKNRVSELEKKLSLK